MSHLELVQSIVAQVARRRHYHRVWVGLWKGLFAGALIWSAALLAYKLFPVPLEVLLAGAVAGILAPPLGLLLASLKRPSLLATARWLDGQTHLADRLTTAIELSSRGPASEWKELQIADAAAHVQNLPTRSLLPFGLPASIRWTVLVLFLSASLGFVPEYRSQAHGQKQREQDNMRQVGKQIADFTRRTLERRAPVLEPVEKALGSIVDLGDELTKAKLSRAEALKEVAKVTDRVEQTARELKDNPALKNLEQARRNAGGSKSPGDSTQKQRDAMQKALDKHSTQAEAFESLKQELQKALQTGSGTQNRDSAEGKSAQERLSKSISALADRAKALGQPLAGLQEALAALQQNDTDLFVQGLNAALSDLDKLQENAKALEQLAEQSGKSGKDLAEQLSRAEIETAQNTLQKMIEQLKSQNLGAAELQKILAEVKEAVNPGGKYGKVGDHLAKAVQQLQLGQKAPGARSLNDAAAELDKLMKELNDMDSLLASLEALRRADMALGMCKGFGQCQGPPRIGQGGRGGPGVGTWADENGLPPAFTELWDYSGMSRSDLDPRGHTDRGEGKIGDNLAPTKVKGQLSPGASMPSITLKGVSVKGQSKIAFQEVLSAAQKEAQSAISQEQVPRAYQGAVKDYFDDLKE